MSVMADSCDNIARLYFHTHAQWHHLPISTQDIFNLVNEQGKKINNTEPPQAPKQRKGEWKVMVFKDVMRLYVIKADNTRWGNRM
jgi:hypothetical protein